MGFSSNLPNRENKKLLLQDNLIENPIDIYNYTNN